MTAYDYQKQEWCEGERGARIAIRNAIKSLGAAELRCTALAAFIDDQLAVIAEANAEITRRATPSSPTVPTSDRPRTTRHTCGGPVFGRKTPGCPRCDELLAGAEPVRWNNNR